MSLSAYRLALCSASVLALMILAGCSPAGTSDRPDTVVVTGAVTYNGVPVAGATVTFKPQASEGRGASGRTDDSGRYQMTTFDPNDGVIPDEYGVTVTKTIVAGLPQGDVEVSLENSGDASSQPAAGSDEPEVILPDKYADAATSGFSAGVTADGENVFDFALVD